jgi:hypothetical protein
MSGNGGGGSGLFGRRRSALPGLTLPAPLASTAAASLTHDEEPRRRHGSAPLASAFALGRRGSMPLSLALAGNGSLESPMTSASSSRRGSTVDFAHPRKTSEPGAVVHKSTIPSLKRKPVPKDSAYDNTSPTKEDGMEEKFNKMDLNSGSTMVSTITIELMDRLSANACAATLTCAFRRQ